ncbi:MAG: fused MFS/spermidine synthase [Aeromicrobium sp.]|nr:fused MFS/spermidine synthase [Burkholderiales bacterium]
MILYASAIFVSAFLLFLVQPVIAKQILPWFGGTAAVWTTCLVFFQSTLLLGYFYSDWSTRKLTPRNQAILHVTLVALTLLLLPIIPDAAWKPAGDEEPTLRIILLLAATIGLPYFLLSTTSPLIQAWFSRSYPGQSPYRLFALSNLASMLALLGYPFLFEPNIATRDQAIGWSIGFAAFAVLISGAAWYALTTQREVAPVAAAMEADVLAPTWREKLLWIVLSAIGSILLLAISNHLTQNISSIPLLWVVPLALYLLTFILTFDGKGMYQRTLILPLLGVLLIGMGWTLADASLHFQLKWQIGIFSAGLFVACMFCHGELVERKPHPKFLTQFYLMISVGGALGAALVGIVAPLTLPAYYELELALIALAALATWLSWSMWSGDRYAPAWLTYAAKAVGIVVCGFCVGATVMTVRSYNDNVVYKTRNFYGTLRVKEYVPPEVEHRRRSLVHGAILHGDQYMDPPYNRSATTYYKTKSGIGLTLLAKEQINPGQPRRVGLVGLGAGTLATYGNKGDTFRFYDINAAVVEIANRDFTYLKESEAKIEVALGDARLNLEREPVQNFDVLAIDAFSSDSIPVHLITLEALDIYAKHMRPEGVIAFHVSNRFLDLKPVVQMLADKRGWHAAWIRDTYEDGSTTSDWVLLTRHKPFLLRRDIVESSYVIPPEPGWRVWTDDFNNLLQVLK